MKIGHGLKVFPHSSILSKGKTRLVELICYE